MNERQKMALIFKALVQASMDGNLADVLFLKKDSDETLFEYFHWELNDEELDESVQMHGEGLRTLEILDEIIAGKR